MESRSVWGHSSKAKYPTLTKDLDAEVIIVGGGIHGVISTYLLSKAGINVCLIEQNTIGSGDTGYTTAFISHQLDTDLAELVKNFSRQNATQVWHSAQAAINQIEEIVRSEKIACDFERTPLVIGASSAEDWHELQAEAQLAGELGFKLQLESTSTAPMAQHGALVVPNQAKFHPLKFLQALADRAVAHGAQIFENTRVSKVISGEKVTLETSKGKISANSLIAATGTPINSPLMIQTKLISINTFVIAGTLSSETYQPGLYIDTESPYHYLRIDRDGKKLCFLFGGEDRPTGDAAQSSEIYQKLETFLKTNLDAKLEVTHHWSGQILHSLDGLPYIGRHPIHRNQYLGCGFAGDGMPFGTLAAMINTDLVLNRNNDFTHLYAPGRIKNWVGFLQKGLKYPTQMMYKYLMHQNGNVSALQAGEGQVIEEQGQKVAVYKNDKGELTKISAVCTHMGCIVNWNSAAKTWDCPCHGSRFQTTGQVINGPATKPLAQL